MGHNLCLDIFGGPSADEAKAGLPAHGETSTAAFDIERTDDQLVLSATLPLSGLFVEREIALVDAGRAGGGLIRVRERVDNMGATDRPVGWTQHVTLGPPFLQPGQTQLRVSATQSRVYEGTFGPADYLAAGADFSWPQAPLAAGGTADLRLVDGAETGQRLHSSSDGSGARTCQLSGLHARARPGVRLRLAPCRLSLDGHVG